MNDAIFKQVCAQQNAGGQAACGLYLLKSSIENVFY